MSKDYAVILCFNCGPKAYLRRDKDEHQALLHILRKKRYYEGGGGEFEYEPIGRGVVGFQTGEYSGFVVLRRDG